MKMKFTDGIKRYPDNSQYSKDLLALWSQKVAEKMSLQTNQYSTREVQKLIPAFC